jgi:hypothetical protein
MATLGELYTSFDRLKSLGLDTTEIELQIRSKEQEVLKKEIIPSIQEVVDVLCSQLRTDVEFTIKHNINNSSSIKLEVPHIVLTKDSYQKLSDASPLTSVKFYVKNQRGALGIGIYDSVTNTFKLLAGSKINGQTSKSFNRKDAYRDITSNYCQLIDGIYLLKKDYSFASPSTASSVVLGRSSNGWSDWKNESGASLSDVYRKEGK